MRLSTAERKRRAAAKPALPLRLIVARESYLLLTEEAHARKQTISKTLGQMLGEARCNNQFVRLQMRGQLSAVRLNVASLQREMHLPSNARLLRDIDQCAIEMTRLLADHAA